MRHRRDLANVKQPRPWNNSPPPSSVNCEEPLRRRAVQSRLTNFEVLVPQPSLYAIDPHGVPDSAGAPAAASASAHAFYAHALEILCASGLPFLVAGTYALNAYTGVRRQT